MAKVVVAFKGVDDGNIYPRDVEVGEIVTGDLAAAAMRSGWVTDEDAEFPGPAFGATPPNTEDQTDPAGKPGGPGEPDGTDAAVVIAIPHDWETLKYPQMRALAARIAPGQAINAETAKAVIRDYLKRPEDGLV